MNLFSKSNLVLTLSLLSLSVTAAAAPLGVAGEFNVFVLDSLNQSNSDIEGRVAVGGNATFSNFSVGSSLSSDGNRLDLVVGGNLTFANGQIANGSGTYGGSATTSGIGTPKGTLKQAPSSIDFAAASQYLLAESQYYASLTGTKVNHSYGTLNLTGADANFNVFQIDAGILAQLNTLNITAAAGSTVIVNVAGKSNTFSNSGMRLSGIGAQNVLFNFHETESLSLSSVGFMGTILAPAAATSFNNAQINGSLITYSLTGTGESHHKLFAGTVPARTNDVPEPATLLVVGAGLIALSLRRRKTAN